MLERLKQKKQWIAQAIILSGAFVALAVFVHYRMDNVLDSDISYQLVLSKLLQEENSIISTDWYYATEIQVFGYNLVFTPLFYLTSDWHIVRTVGNLILYFLLVLSVYYFSKQAGINKYFGILGVVFVIPFSTTYYNYVLKNVNYVNFLIISFFSVGMMFNLYNAKKKIRKRIIAFLLCAAAFLSGLNGLRQMYITYAPLFLSGLFYIFYNRKALNISSVKELKECRYSKFTGYALTAMLFNIAGYVINSKILAYYYSFENYETNTWNGFSITKLESFIGGFFTNMGLSSSDEIFSFGAVHIAVCFLTIFFTVSAVWHILKAGVKCRFESAIIAYFIVGASIISLILYCFTTMKYGARYDLLWQMYFFPLIIAYVTEKICDAALRKGILISLIIGIGICSIDFYVKYVNVDTTSDLRNIVTVLEDNGYQNGYATFWNANVVTELSNGYLEVWDWGDFYNDFNTIDQTYQWGQQTSHAVEHPEGKIFWILTEQQDNNFHFTDELGSNHILYASSDYRVYSFNSYEEMCGLIGTCNFTERSFAGGEKTYTENAMTLYPDTYLLICRGENLRDTDIELSYDRIVSYKNNETQAENLAPEYFQSGEDYIVCRFTVEEIAYDFTAAIVNNSESEARITYFEIMKASGTYADFYNNLYCALGYDDMGTRHLLEGGMSYGPYITLVPGIYAVECSGSGLDKVTFESIYNNGSGQAALEISNVEQTESKIYYEIIVNETVLNYEMRFYNISEQEVELSGLHIKMTTPYEEEHK